MKQAKASYAEWERLVKWLTEQEDNGVTVPPWMRVVFGYEMLVKNCCDPDKDYLDWKPGIIVPVRKEDTP